MAFVKAICGIILGVCAVFIALKLLGVVFGLMAFFWVVLKLAVAVGLAAIVFYAVYKLITGQNKSAA